MELGALLRQRLRDGRDLRALVDELERTAAASESADVRSSWLFWLGQVCESLVPERARALALYRRAWEEDRGNHGAVERAIALARQLGRLDELVYLAGTDLDAEQDPDRQRQLAAVVGEALLDLGQRQRAASMLVSAASNFPDSLPIQDGLATVGYEDDWRADVARLVALAGEAEAPDGQRARLYLRAARIFHMEAPDAPEIEQLLRRALEHDPHDESAHYLIEWVMARAERWTDLAAHQWRRVEAMPDPLESADLCLRYAFAWAERFRDRERAAAWCTHALDLGRLEYPIAAVTLLRDLLGPKRQWADLIELLDQVLNLPLD
ncbi:MAG TPA: hypothetical protein VFF06_28720, partial [Polyangia bacterium]|nr:hypothetical protein [Polyangia bacterium]